MFCENCGKEIKDENKFCPYCGASVQPEQNGEQPEQSAQPEQKSEQPKQSAQSDQRLCPEVMLCNLNRCCLCAVKIQT